MGLSAGADVREELTRRRGSRGCSSSPTSTTRSSPSRSRRSRPATATSSAAAPRSRSAATCGSADRTCGCGSPGPPSASRSARPAWSPSAACATAKYLLFTSRTVGADEALRLGLVNRVAPAAATEEAAVELATAVAAHPPEARRAPEADAPRLGRRRGPLGDRGRGPGRVAALRPGPAAQPDRVPWSECRPPCSARDLAPAGRCKPLVTGLRGARLRPGRPVAPTAASAVEL